MSGLRKFTIDPNKPFFIYNTAGEWLATKLGMYIYDTRGDYVAYVLTEDHEVYTTSGEWIGNLYPDGRIVRKRTFTRKPLMKELPPKPEKPKLPARAPLQPNPADLGFDKIDVLEWDEEILKRLSDLIPDQGEDTQ
jgi:hypothetical protein